MPKWVIDIIEAWIVNKKTGSITINFFQGGISNIVKSESIKQK